MSQRPIDVHAHVVPPNWEDWSQRYGKGAWPRLEHQDSCSATLMTGDRAFRKMTDQSWDPARRIEDMERIGIGMQVLSPPPIMFCYWADAPAAAAFARMQNENTASVVARHPRHFLGMATLPLQDIDLAIVELRHARETLGFTAIEIGTCPAGRDLDDATLLPFFQACSDLGMAIFVHPASPIAGGERLAKYYFNNIVGNPIETALAISKLIAGGVLDRFPALRFCFAHGGGAFFSILGRLAHGWSIRPELSDAIGRSPVDYASRLYFDTLTHDGDFLRFIAAKGWRDQLVLGSDYPFKLGDADPLASLKRAGFAQDDIDQIACANARRFLGTKE